MEGQPAEGIYASTADSQHCLSNAMNQDQGLTLYPASQSFLSANLLSHPSSAQVVASSNDAFGGMGAVAHQNAGCSDLAGDPPAPDIACFIEDDCYMSVDILGEKPGPEALVPMVDSGYVGEELQNSLLQAAPTVAFTSEYPEDNSHGSADARSSLGATSFPGPTLPPTTCANPPEFGKYTSFQITAAPATRVPGCRSASAANPSAARDIEDSALLLPPQGSFHAPPPRYLSPYTPIPGNGVNAPGNTSSCTIAPISDLQPSAQGNSEQALPSPTHRTRSHPVILPEGHMSGTDSGSVTSAPGYLSGNPHPVISAPNQAAKVFPGQLLSSNPGPSGTAPMPVSEGTSKGSSGPQMAPSAPAYNVSMIYQKLDVTSQRCSHIASLLAPSAPVSHEQPPVLNPEPKVVSGGLLTPELTPPLTSGRPLPGTPYRELWGNFQSALKQLAQYRVTNVDLGIRATKLEKQVKRERDKNQQCRNERDKYMRICGEWMAPASATGKTKGEMLTSQVASLNNELVLAMKSKALMVEDLAAETKKCRELEVQLEARDDEIRQLKLALEESKNGHTGNSIQDSASKTNRNNLPKKENVALGGLVLPGNVPFTPSTRLKAATPPAPAPTPPPRPPPRPAVKPRRRAAKPRCSVEQNSTSDRLATATTAASGSSDANFHQTDSQIPNQVVTIDLTTPPTTPFKPMKRKREYTWLQSNKVAKPTPYPSERRRAREVSGAPTAATARAEELPAVGGDEEEWAAFTEEFEKEMMNDSGVEENSGGQDPIESNGDGVVELHPGAGDWTEFEAELEKELNERNDDVLMLSGEPSGGDEGMERRKAREESVDSLFDS
ncbi:MAG: hypothetical protein M1840_002344 [Geoglossum simile]|nr:MAG: hypothetical protein M1840_002344 [Geoglossum simile]